MDVTKFVKNDTEKWGRREWQVRSVERYIVKTFHGTLNFIFVFIKSYLNISYSTLTKDITFFYSSTSLLKHNFGNGIYT